MDFGFVWPRSLQGAGSESLGPVWAGLGTVFSLGCGGLKQPGHGHGSGWANFSGSQEH